MTRGGFEELGDRALAATAAIACEAAYAANAAQKLRSSERNARLLGLDFELKQLPKPRMHSARGRRAFNGLQPSKARLKDPARHSGIQLRISSRSCG